MKIYCMDATALDKALTALIAKKEALAKIDYNNPKYDDLEDELHDLEDDFQDKYGDYLEGVLQKVHDKFCSENDVLMPVAYLGNGVAVDADAHPGKNAKLLLVAGPPRIVLVVGKDKQEVVWTLA
ncbi:MAG: hypothetical protein ACK48F_05205 [Chryseotalea sp.]